MLHKCDGDIISELTYKDYARTLCEKSIKELFPGDTFVDFIVVSAVNDAREEWRSSKDLIHKGMFAAS